MSQLEENQESKQLQLFRATVKDLDRDDRTLRRFLRARDYDLPKAEEMLRKCMKWRQENDIDGHRKWEISNAVIDAFPHSTYGKDFDGRNVYYFPVGNWEVRQMIDKGYSEDMLKLMLSQMESIISGLDKSGNDQFTLICDLEGLTYWKVAHYESKRKYLLSMSYLTTIQMVLKVFRDFEQNYPERLGGEAFVINAPLVLNCVWPLVKPLLHGRTLSKVRFIGSDPAKYIPELLKVMPPEAMSPKLHETMKSLRTANNA